jgi:hypothetical protein
MPPETDNLRLEEIYAADQKDRERVYSAPLEIEALKNRDIERRRELLEMIGQGGINTANDMYRGAVLLLHGAEPKDFLCAHRLAVMASIQGHRPSRWLSAASLDRFLMSIGLPQTYGTQFELNKEENKYQLRLPIDDTRVLHFEKEFLNVPPLAERLLQLNKKISST